MLISIAEQGDYLITFDLRSGYHYIDIQKEFLGFEWGDEYFEFTVLPFGLAIACYLFTKMLRPLVKHWRSLGIKVVLYIDDGIVLERQVEYLYRNQAGMLRSAAPRVVQAGTIARKS